MLNILNIRCSEYGVSQPKLSNDKRKSLNDNENLQYPFSPSNALTNASTSLSCMTGVYSPTRNEASPRSAKRSFIRPDSGPLYEQIY